MNRETWLAHAGSDRDPMTGAVVPPLHLSTTFRRDDQYQLPSEHVYARYGHPLSRHAEDTFAHLEGGAAALVFNSGMAAMSALLESLPASVGVAVPRVMYHGGRDLVQRIAGTGRIELYQFDATDPAGLARLLDEHSVDLVWVETISNPMWEVADIGGLAAVTAAAGARLAVDSTVTPPVTFRPLEHGADYVFHSATKYLNGHSDVTAGVVVARDEDERWAEAAAARKLTGSVLPPFETWLLLRGLRTLHLRYARASANAQAVAEHLDRHPRVDSVLYPGLAGHPGHALAMRQFDSGCGGMLSVLVAGGREEAIQVATRLDVISPATSLGGVESLVEHRASVEGPDSDVPANLLRFSIGIEDPADLLADLDRAFD